MDEVKLLPCEVPPTHYCVVCAARWVNHADGSWSLASAECGPCCDNVPMDTAPIVRIQPDGSVDGRDHDKVRRAYDAVQRKSQVERYRGILCAHCDEPFERHSSDWTCPRRVVPRFKFPAELEATRHTLVTDEVVERVARALRVHRWHSKAWPTSKQPDPNNFIFLPADLAEARAALAAVEGDSNARSE